MQLDFTNLRKITNGDSLLESELFGIFIETAQECIQFMRESLKKNDENLWRTQAHVLKGVSFSIGANDLGTLCKLAQENYGLPKEVKQPMLRAIEDSYAEVKRYMQSHLPQQSMV